MSSLRTFRIQFDQPGAIYQAGKTVTGKIIIDMAKNKIVRGLYFVAKGSANVFWTETSSSTDSDNNTTSTTESYSASEHYFTIGGDALGTRDTDSRVELKEGYHQFPFQFDLPYNIPSSFENTDGHIRYTVKATINKPWNFDSECKAAFSVVSILNLNQHRERCVGIYDDIRKNFSCCCCSVGSMNITMRVPSSGYVPGQVIDTLVNFTNSTSDVTIQKISTKLERVLRFHATSKTLTKNFDITSSSYGGPFSTRGETNLEIRVPPLPPSNLLHCKIIDLDYNLKIVVEFQGPHFKVQRIYPLLIGSIPLNIAPSVPCESPRITKERVQSIPMPGCSASNAQPLIGFAIPDQADTSKNWNIPPPSYEECVSGAEHIRDQDESDFVQGVNIPFSPKYPVFNYPAPSVPKKRTQN